MLCKSRDAQHSIRSTKVDPVFNSPEIRVILTPRDRNHVLPEGSHNCNRPTMTKPILVVLSTLLVCNTSVSAFGPRLESPYSFYGSSSTVLKATASDRDDEEELCRGLMALEPTQVLHPNSQSVFDLLFNQAGKNILLDEPYAMEDLLLSGLQTYEESLAVEEDSLSCGADCEDCLIPEEFKSFPGNQAFDVMAYLGIKRAEPVGSGDNSEFQ